MSVVSALPPPSKEPLSSPPTPFSCKGEIEENAGLWLVSKQLRDLGSERGIQEVAGCGPGPGRPPPQSLPFPHRPMVESSLYRQRLEVIAVSEALLLHSTRRPGPSYSCPRSLPQLSLNLGSRLDAVKCVYVVGRAGRHPQLQPCPGHPTEILRPLPLLPSSSIWPPPPPEW